MGIQRPITLALSFAVVALSAALALQGGPRVEAGSVGASAVVGDAGARSDAGPAALGFDASLVALPEPIAAAAGGFPPVDRTPVAPPNGAPRHVRFGVVLVAYEGAEGTADKGARKKSDALALATKLADEAKGDFHGTVGRGDTGSSEDVGEVTRGVLEPATEAALFALPVGGVSGVIDTPRGFWVVKRLE